MGVNHVQLGNGETVVDLRGITVNEDVLLEGYTAIDSKGNPVTGKASQQGGGSDAVSELFWVTGEMDLASMIISNMSHSYSEVIAAMDAGKMIKFKCSYRLPADPTSVNYAFGDINARLSDYIMGQIMIHANLGSGRMLYYFSVIYRHDSSIVVTPYIVNTTAIGG